MAEFKRVHYYNHQYLREPDFTAEQDYHLSMRRRHNRSLHTWGIVDGLLISNEGDGKIRVSAGMAIDKHGREMEFDGGTLDIAVETDAVRFVIITHVEEQTDPPEEQFKINDTDRTRWTERAEVRIVSEAPANPGQNLIVGRITIKGGTISIDDGLAPKQRRFAGASGGSFHTRGGEQWGAWNYGANLIIDGGRNNAIALLDGTSANPWAIANAGGELTIAQMPPLGDLSTAPTRRLLIDQDGNVGIGTGEPAAKLHLHHDKENVSLMIQNKGDVNKWCRIHFITTNSHWTIGTSNNWQDNIFYLFNERQKFPENLKLAIKPNGNVGIGATSPDHRLQIGDANSPISMSLRGPDHNTEASVLAFEDDGGSAERWFRLINDTENNLLKLSSKEEDTIIAFDRKEGKVGIGTASPKAKLDVHGDLRVAGDANISGMLNKLDVAASAYAIIRAHDLKLGHPERLGEPGRALVDYEDALHLNYGGDWPDGVIHHGSMKKASSRKFKKNISELSIGEAFEILKGLHPVRFNLKAEAGKRIHLGFIAEDTHPYVASEGRDAIDNDHIVAVLTRVVKAQQKTMAEFEQKLKLMEKA